MDPVEALKEIAFLLERERASEFKTKAFRAAAAVLAKVPAAQRQEQVDSGQLKRTKGIGGTTYEVIVEALAGDVPSYLTDARERGTKSQASGGEKLLAVLKGDLHAHSDWSDGTTSIELMVTTAQALGREYLALTDHSPRLRIANGLTVERLRQQLDVVAAINKSAHGFRLLSGIEVDILDDGGLDQTDAMLSRLDIVVASVHSKLRMESREMTERMLGAVEDPHTNILGHCTGRLVEGSRGTRPPSTFDAKAVFAACAANNVAVEINSRPERRDPPGPLIDLALKAGCLFSIDTDAHAPGQLGLLDYGAARAQAHDIPPARIVTTWPLDRVLDWAKA
jgi:putative hydrolase